MIQRLVHEFIFAEFNRSQLTFSDATKIHLDSLTNVISLKPIGVESRTGRKIYSTEANLYVKTATFNPKCLQKFFAFSATPRPTLQPSQTTVAYRLNNGTSDYYWDGVSWVVAGASDWNSEAVVVANIDSFPATNQHVAVLVNLKTTDKYVTPTISQVDIGYEGQIDYIRSIITSLLYSMDASLRYSFRTTVEGNGTNSIVLPAFDPTYNIVSLEAAYNITDDPNMVTNIGSAYNTGTRTLTLTTTPASNKVILVRFRAKPQVAFSLPSQDYYENKSVPATTINRMDVSGAQVVGSQVVKNVAAGTASVRYNPYRLNISFGLLVEAEAADTKLHLIESVISYFRNTPLLHWRDLDKQLSMRIVSEGVYNPTPNLKDGYESTFTFALENIFLWLDSEQSKYLVLEVNTTLDRRQ